MGMETLAVINIGSASYKYALYTGDTLRIAEHYERTETGFACTRDDADVVAIDQETFDRSRDIFFEAVQMHGHVLSAIAVRVVAPGSFFATHRKVDDEYLAALDAVRAYDPAHSTPVYTLLKALRETHPTTPLIAVSDSAFHSTLAPSACAVPLPENVLRAHDFSRFGYHGIALSAIARKVAPYPRVVVCHLGSGASVTALKNGVSMDTSMGYSPLEGLVMSSRSGSVDPAIIVRLCTEYSPEQVLTLLYKESGLKALSGLSDDMRVLLAAIPENSQAQHAVDTFVYRIVHYIGAYAALLGGLDALVFSGTIGERSYPIRRMVCERLSAFGVVLDEIKHAGAQVGDMIQREGPAVLILHADELQEAARLARSVQL
mgnify:CR=1 FL=1